MDTQLKIERYKKALATYVKKLAVEYSTASNNDIFYQAIVDREGNHFQLVKMGWHKQRYIYAILFHLDINAETGNIWIRQNNTEIQLDVELEKFANIPKQHLVLGFRRRSLRELSDYAVA